MQDQETDPLTCYLIVNEQLGMSMGKAAAQTAHAMQYLLVRLYSWRYDDLRPTDRETLTIIRDFDEWMKGNHRKVVLKADPEEWVKLKELPHVLVKDAGLTEIPSGSETCIGLFPMRKSVVPKIVKRLQTLK